MRGRDAALDAALATCRGYDWIVFTSANGVAAVQEQLAGKLAGREGRRGRAGDRRRGAGARRRARVRPRPLRGRGDRRRASARSRARACCFRRPTSPSPASPVELRARGALGRRGRRVPDGRDRPVASSTRASSRAASTRSSLASGSAARSLAASRRSSTTRREVADPRLHRPEDGRSRAGGRVAGRPRRRRGDRRGHHSTRSCRTSGREAHDRVRETSPLDALRLEPEPTGRAGCGGRRRCATSCARRRSRPTTSSTRSSSSPARTCAGPSPRCRGSTSSRSTRSRGRRPSSRRSASRPCSSSASRAPKDALGLESFADDGVVQRRFAR